MGYIETGMRYMLSSLLESVTDAILLGGCGGIKTSFTCTTLLQNAYQFPSG